ncbi:aldehyde dehydrogenase family protein [Phyllobacterium chamaecytisi]|uniref:aldehyde dehydrogenase family protein n=1 Tax=Phyllobacterium chamaecytisi TaxID=2876082 RepID=UPI0021068F47|nr:aldehyde dehydrogenase family protein [Phyllobacterium sp. KW56]
MPVEIAAALAVGCPTILKGSEEAPSSAVQIVEAVVPVGVVNLLFGDPAPISEALLASPEIELVSFTGSTAV